MKKQIRLLNKSIMKTCFALLGLSLAFCAPVLAEDKTAPSVNKTTVKETKQKSEKPGKTLVDSIFSRFDKDGDNRLSREETKAFLDSRRAARNEARPRNQRQQQLLKRFDKNKDGKLSAEENEAMKKARENQRKAFLKKWDNDKDGKMSLEERKAAREQIRKQRQEMIKKFDKDKNGRLSPAERKALQEARKTGSVQQGSAPQTEGK